MTTCACAAICYNMMYKLDKFRLWHITTNLFDLSWKCDKIVYKATRTLIKTLHTIYKNQLIFSKVITVNILTLKNRKIRNILNSQLEKTDVNLHSDIGQTTITKTKWKSAHSSIQNIRCRS